jgi:hypothetical protein
VVEAVPLTGGLLDQWTAGLPPEEVGPTLVATGASQWHLTSWPSRDYRTPGFLPWPAEDPPGPELARLWASSPSARWLQEPTDPDQSYRWQAHPALRLALAGNTIPTEVVPRLLGCPAVASVVVPVELPPGALRRRPWLWPLRLGVLDDELLAQLRKMGGAHQLPGKLVEVLDVRTDPAAVGILVVRQSPAAAADLVTAYPQIANAVLCVGGPGPEPWPVTDSRLALIRALTGAVVTGIVDPAPTDLAMALLRTLRFVAHGHTFDVAVTAAFERHILLAGELDALDQSHLPEVFRARAAQYRRDMSGAEHTPATVPALTALEAAAAALEAAAEGNFDAESQSSTDGAEEIERIESTLDQAEATRVLQAYVARPGAGPRARRDNVIRAGANLVEVFVGPEETGALQGTKLTNEELGFLDASTTSVRLSAVLVPILPIGDPVWTELEVPRLGRSANAVLPWQVPADAATVQARIVLLHRNRVIQTAVLSGAVGGGPATLSERIVLWPELGHLDERRAFDRAFVMNHNDRGESMCASFANGQHVTIGSIDEIKSVADHIRNLLIQAAKAKTESESELRPYIAELSVHGRDLEKRLRKVLGEIGSPQRIQVLTARPSWMLPLEFVYDRPANRKAELCARWLDGEACGSQCFKGDDDDSVVCPSVFWGMSRVIERYYTEMDSTIGDTFWVRATPSLTQSEFVPTRAALAASRKVKVTDVEATAKVLGPGVTALAGWEQWKAALKANKTDLLVLMPHSDPKTVTLEVSGKTLARGEIEKWYVTGGQDVMPMVILFGCDTAGFKDDPAGYASAFIQEKACAVFSTFTMVLGSHAARMSQRLIAEFMQPERKRVPMGEALAKFRSDLARDGLLAGLSITAYGDSAWKV